MTDSYIKYIAERLQLASWQVENTVELLEEGATIPFISRYRKERTGGIDETYVAQIKHYFVYLTDLDKRKQAIVKSIEQQDKMTPELAAEIEAAVDARVLEDIYLPYKPKRRTRASVAKEKGLEPLALKLYEVKTDDIYAAAAPFCNDYVPTKDDALAGASDIIAEWLSEDTAVRQELRDLYYKWGTIVSRVAKGKEDDEKTEKYQTYSNFSQCVDKIPPHRLLAILRGASEEVLTAKIEVNEDYAYERMERCAFRGKRKPSAQLRNFLSGAVGDAYKRLLHPSIENEVLAIAKEKADIESIKVFGENLRQLLLAPPALTPASAPAARWCASTPRASCCTMTLSIRTLR